MGRLPVVLALALAALLPGCTYSGGQLLFMLGAGKGKKIEAKFTLTRGPVLILVDDVDDRVDWPLAKEHLADNLAQELLKNDAAAKIVPPATVQSLKQADPEFDKRSCREIGEKAGAEQVIWIEVVDFLITEDIGDVHEAAYMVVSVKVINPLEKTDRNKVRLWPDGVTGQVVSARLASSDILRLKTKDAISQELTGELADKIAKLFYKHRLGDFEKEE